jgi:predicted hydrolase (HD superfamily)
MGPLKPARVRKNRENLAGFFAGEDRFGRKRSQAAEAFTPERALELVRLYCENEAAMEHLQAYARRFKQAAREEITAEDVREAWDLMRVRKVMES